MKIKYIILICTASILSLGCSESSNSSASVSNQSQAVRQDTVPNLKDILVLMISTSQKTSKNLENLKDNLLTPQQKWDAVQSLSKEFNNTITGYSSKIEEFPSNVKETFFSSSEGTKLMNDLNQEMKKVKEIAFEIGKEKNAAPLGFQEKFNVKDAKSVIESQQNWPTEPKKYLDAKYGFMYSYIGNSEGDFTLAERKSSLAGLKNLYDQALKGDKVATAKLNGWLNEALEIYPKDHYAAQYNLGLLYRDIGKTDEAKKWLKKSAAQGCTEARIALEQLK